MSTGNDLPLLRKALANDAERQQLSLMLIM